MMTDKRRKAIKAHSVRKKEKEKQFEDKTEIKERRKEKTEALRGELKTIKEEQK